MDNNLKQRNYAILYTLLTLSVLIYIVAYIRMKGNF